MSPDDQALADAIADLPAALQAHLVAGAFDLPAFLSLARTLREGDPRVRRAQRNRVKGPVTVPGTDELPAAPTGAEAQRLAREGEALIARGGLAFCVMAGGMATRMGGVVKALVPVVDGATFLDLRLAENRLLRARYGVDVPLWLMTSDATDDALLAALAERGSPPHVRTFRQNLGLRLTPEGALFRESDGSASPYATGHGDLPDALRRSGLLDAFVSSGGEVVWITNVDNLGATVDPALLGAFLESGKDVMVEVCPKVPGDKGGIPAHAEGKLQVLEEFRLPEGFDAAQVRVFNTNTFLTRAEALRRPAPPSTYFEVEKSVEGRPAIQFERLLQELTAAFDAGYVQIAREGLASRFEPVKDVAELEARRAKIRAILESRGIFGPRPC